MPVGQYRMKRHSRQERAGKSGREKDLSCGLVYMCESETKREPRLVRVWNDEYAPAIQSRPFMGFPGKSKNIKH